MRTEVIAAGEAHWTVPVASCMGFGRMALSTALMSLALSFRRDGWVLLRANADVLGRGGYAEIERTKPVSSAVEFVLTRTASLTRSGSSPGSGSKKRWINVTGSALGLSPEPAVLAQQTAAVLETWRRLPEAGRALIPAYSASITVVGQVMQAHLVRGVLPNMVATAVLLPDGLHVAGEMIPWQEVSGIALGPVGVVTSGGGWIGGGFGVEGALGGVAIASVLHSITTRHHEQIAMRLTTLHGGEITLAVHSHDSSAAASALEPARRFAVEVFRARAAQGFHGPVVPASRTSVPALFCTGCGARLVSESRYCGGCGHAVDR